MKNKYSTFFVLIFLFSLMGLVLISDVSLIEAEKNFGDKFHFIKKHSVSLVLGLAGFTLASKVNYQIWKKISFWLFLFSLFPLAAILFPSVGEVIWGSKRWLRLGPINFQPSELTKYSLIIYLSSLLAEKKASFAHLFALLLPPIILIMLEPDFGTTTIIVASAFAIWSLSGVSIKKIVLPVVGFALISFLLVYFSDYRKQRVLGALDPFYDKQGKSYHSYQLVLTLGSGGLWGVGMGKSRQKYQYLPQVTTDSIMAIVGEEFGLVGLTIIMSMFITFLFLGFAIALKSKDKFGKLFSAGLISLLGMQGFINLSSIAILLPLTGVPFPLVSYGGTSLVLTLFSLGIMRNIYKQTI